MSVHVSNPESTKTCAIFGIMPEAIRRTPLERPGRLPWETALRITKVAESSAIGSCGHFVYFSKRRAGTRPHRFRVQLTPPNCIGLA